MSVKVSDKRNNLYARGWKICPCPLTHLMVSFKIKDDECLKKGLQIFFLRINVR